MDIGRAPVSVGQASACRQPAFQAGSRAKRGQYNRNIIESHACAIPLGHVCLGSLWPNSDSNSPSRPPRQPRHRAGTGYAAAETVALFFDQAYLTAATTSNTGAFTASITIPASATPGLHSITGLGRQSGLTAQATFKIQTDWPQFLGGPEHHGYNTTENVLNVSNVGNLQLLWSATTPGSNSSPVLANGVLYVDSHCQYLYAFAAATGKKLWMAVTGDSPNHFTPTPAIASGVIYAGSNDGLYAFSTSTGQLLWSTLPGYSVEAVTVANGVVYAGDGPFQALDAATGKQLWTANINSYIDSMPAVANGRVYKGSLGEVMYALNAATGTQIWQSAFENGSFGGATTVSNGLVYGQAYSWFYAFNAANGKLVWSADVGSTTSSSPAVANGIVYEGSYAFDAMTGKVIWQAPLSSDYSTAVVANGVVYMAGQDSNVYAFNAATGEKLWSAPTDTSVASAFVVADGILYAASYDTLYAWSLPATLKATTSSSPASGKASSARFPESAPPGSYSRR